MEAVEKARQRTAEARERLEALEARADALQREIQEAEEAVRAVHETGEGTDTLPGLRRRRLEARLELGELEGERATIGSVIGERERAEAEALIRLQMQRAERREKEARELAEEIAALLEELAARAERVEELEVERNRSASIVLSAARRAGTDRPSIAYTHQAAGLEWIKGFLRRDVPKAAARLREARGQARE